MDADDDDDDDIFDRRLGQLHLRESARACANSTRSCEGEYELRI